jgi:Flp pilus assembly protein TadG
VNARGAVTAEFAVALPAVLLLLALLLSGAAAGVTQLRLEEAARAGARALARGEDPAAVEGIVRALAGTTAAASVVADGEWLSVIVADRVGGPLGATVPWTLTAKATSRSETAAASGPAIPGRTMTGPAVHRVSPTQSLPRWEPQALDPPGVAAQLVSREQLEPRKGVVS